MGGGIYTENGSSFEMLDGKIEGNIIDARSTNLGNGADGAGVTSYNSYFHLSGGFIRNNSVYSYAAGGWGGAYGGGVYIPADNSNTSTFVMDGGVISGNNAACSVNPNTGSSYTLGAYGGGVGVHETGGGGSCIMTKTGGIIYGNDVSGNDADGYPLKNTAQSDSSNVGGGHAVFFTTNGNTTIYRRNATSYETDDIDSSQSGSAGGWE
jgi:hypothetical protein